MKNFDLKKYLAENKLNEADPIDLEPGTPDRTVNHDRKMAMKNVINVLTAENIELNDIYDFIKTHKDDFYSGDIDAYDAEDIKDNWEEYQSVNFESGSDFTDLNEDEEEGNINLKRGEEYEVLEPGMEEWHELEYVGFDRNEDSHIFIDAANVAPGSNEVFVMNIPNSELSTSVK